MKLERLVKLFQTKSTQQLKINQWKNTQNVVKWFMKIEEKSNHKFIGFDVKDFYPSVRETLLIKAINFAEKRVKITNEDTKNYKTRKGISFIQQ